MKYYEFKHIWKNHLYAGSLALVFRRASVIGLSGIWVRLSARGPRRTHYIIWPAGCIYFRSHSHNQEEIKQMGQDWIRREYYHIGVVANPFHPEFLKRIRKKLI